MQQQAVRGICDEFVSQSSMNNADSVLLVEVRHVAVFMACGTPGCWLWNQRMRNSLFMCHNGHSNRTSKACAQLRDLDLRTSGRTFYARGIQGIEVFGT
eukprot:4670472-Amphidinium_carterae.1